MGAQASSQHTTNHNKVISIHSLNKWNTHFENRTRSNKLMVIDFTAAWCGPCKFIEPAVHDFANEYTDVEFIKIDVDELPDVAKDFGVQAMPAFILIKNGKECDRIIGAKKGELQRTIEKHRF